MISSCQALVKKGKGAQDGIAGRDYLDNCCASTQGCLFSLIHWGKSLDSEKSKTSSFELFDSLLDIAMGKTKHVMILNSTSPCGTFASDGVQVPVQHGRTSDCTGLGVEFPFVKKALNRNAVVISIYVDTLVTHKVVNFKQLTV